MILDYVLFTEFLNNLKVGSHQLLFDFERIVEELHEVDLVLLTFTIVTASYCTHFENLLYCMLVVDLYVIEFCVSVCACSFSFNVPLQCMLF